MGKLTAIRVKNETKPGRHTDGAGLHLHIRASGRRAWVFRHMRDGKLRVTGLGGYPDVSRAGIDPIEARRAEKNRDDASRTFRVAAECFISSQRAGWANEKPVR